MPIEAHLRDVDLTAWTLVIRGRPLTAEGLLVAAGRTRSEFSWQNTPLAAISAEVTGTNRTADELLAGPRLRTRRTYASTDVVTLMESRLCCASDILVTPCQRCSAPLRCRVRGDTRVHLWARATEPALREVTAMTARVSLPADVHQIDASGYVWTFLDEADDPTRVQIGAVIVAGDSDDPFLARVIGIVPGNSGRDIVHLDVLGVPDQLIDELRHANLLST
jgi:hypothetical protein